MDIENDKEKRSKKKLKLIFYYLNFLTAAIGLGLVALSTYISVTEGTDSPGLYPGTIIAIYSAINIIKDNPYKLDKNETEDESDEK